MKKLFTSALALVALSIGFSAHAETQFAQVSYENSLPVLSGLKVYKTVAEVKALNAKVIAVREGNETDFDKVKVFDANQDGVIVLSEVIDMVNANVEAPDYTTLDDLTMDDIEQLGYMFANLQNYINFIKK